MEKKKRENRCAGFTLVELLIVIAIIALVGMVTAPRVADSYRAMRFDTISDQLLNDLRFARRSAMDLNTRIKVDFTGGVDYTITTEDGRELRKRVYPESKAGWKITFAGGTKLFFNNQGLPQKEDGKPVGGELTITGGSGRRRVFTLYVTGMIR